MKLKTIFKILIISSVLLPILIVGTVGSIAFDSFYRNMTASETASAAYSAVKSQGAVLDRYAADLAVMGQSGIIRRTAGGDYNAIKEQVDELLFSKVNEDAALKDLIIMDGNGYAVASASPASLAQTYKDFDKLTAVPDGITYVSDISFDNSKYENTSAFIYIIKKITTATGNIGYLGAVADAAVICSDLAAASFFDGNGGIIFTDSSGNALNINGGAARSTEWSLPFDISDNLAINPGENNQYTEFNENGYYGAYGKLNDSGWQWIASYPASAASLEIVPAAVIGLVIFAAFIVLDLIIAFVIYRRIIPPIEKMSAAMKEINTEDRQKRIHESNLPELQTMSTVFNSLLDDFYISEDIQKGMAPLLESMMFEWDIQSEALYVSQNFREFFDIDYEKANIFEEDFLPSLMGKADAKRFIKDMSALSSGLREYAENEFKIKTRNNTVIWFDVKANAVTDSNGSVTKITGVVTDINIKKKSNLQLSQKTSYDFLSRLYSRNTFLKEFQRLLDMKRINEKYSILFIDISNLKFINGKYGYDVGDEVIKHVSDTIQELLGNDGVAGRLNGDEFAVCITNKEKAEHTEEFTAKLISVLYNEYKCKNTGATLKINVKIGVAIAPEHGTDAEELLGAADEAVYFVKKNGNSDRHYYVFDPSTALSLDLGNTMI